MPPCASGFNVGIRGGRGVDFANAPASALIMNRGRLEGGYLVLRHEATVLEGNAMASFSKRSMIYRSILRFMIIAGFFVTVNFPDECSFALILNP